MAHPRVLFLALLAAGALIASACYNGDALQDIQANAGLSDPSALVASSTIVASTPGQTIEDVDVTGSIVVNADNVTIRNVRVTGTSSTALIKPASGVRGTTVEHCEIVVGDGGANGGIGYLGYETTVRYCDISGNADGIKVEGGTATNPSLYEHNYIHMTKPVGSTKHLDGIQASGDSFFVIRDNYIDAHVDRGGNAAVFVQAWWGGGSSHVYDVYVDNNILVGGNYTVYLEGGKPAQDGQPAGYWVHNYNFDDNLIPSSDEAGNPPYRYGLLSVANCDETTISENYTYVGGGPALVDVC